MYLSRPLARLRADGYHHASFQVVHYTMKPGDIVTGFHGSPNSKRLVITPEGTHSVDVVADTIQGVNQGAARSQHQYIQLLAQMIMPAEDGS